MTNDLIERYIYATTKRLPEKVKNDVSDELRTLIDDMLMERCGDITPTEKDIKVVLTELGTPNELYEKYNPDSHKCLIGAPYYTTYKYVLKIVMICMIIVIAFSTIILGIIDTPLNDGGSDLTWISASVSIITDFVTSLCTGAMSAFAIVTLIFAILYHKNIKIDTTSNLDDLPPVPKKNQMISVWDPIIGIAISVVFLAVFLFAPQIFCVVRFTDATKIIPIFNVETIRATWYIIVIFSAVGIVREVIKLIERRYNKRVMLSTIVADVISAIFSVIWLSNSKIMNPDFAGSATEIFEDKSEVIINIFANFQYFFLGCILFALLLDIFDTVVKTLKAK